jgi:hypothetical protein
MATPRLLPNSAAALLQLNSSFLSHLPNFNFAQVSTLNIHLNQTNFHFPTQGALCQQLIPVKEVITNYLDSLSYVQFTFAWFLIVWTFLPLFQKEFPKVPTAPYHGYRWWFEPTWLLQARYVLGARNIISSGYQKVCCICLCVIVALIKCAVQRYPVCCSKMGHRYDHLA